MTISVQIRGKHYSSMSSAANALGVSVNAIHAAKRENRLDTVGLNPRNGRACRVLGRKFNSLAAVARAMGVSADRVYRAVAKGNLDELAREHRDQLEAHHKRQEALPWKS